MPLRVLIVEDEHIIALDLKDILEGAGHTVIGHAASKEEALRLAARMSPDVALIDVDLKGAGEGLGVAETLGSRHRTPALFLTGRSDFLVRAMALAIEPLGYITKPYEAADILAALNRLPAR